MRLIQWDIDYDHVYPVGHLRQNSTVMCGCNAAFLILLFSSKLNFGRYLWEAIAVSKNKQLGSSSTWAVGAPKISEVALITSVLSGIFPEIQKTPCKWCVWKDNLEPLWLILYFSRGRSGDALIGDSERKHRNFFIAWVNCTSIFVLCPKTETEKISKLCTKFWTK